MEWECDHYSYPGTHWDCPDDWNRYVQYHGGGGD